jgi:hypothetical protein
VDVVAPNARAVIYARNATRVSTQSLVDAIFHARSGRFSNLVYAFSAQLIALLATPTVAHLAILDSWSIKVSASWNAHMEHMSATVDVFSVLCRNVLIAMMAIDVPNVNQVIN